MQKYRPDSGSRPHNPFDDLVKGRGYDGVRGNYEDEELPRLTRERKRGLGRLAVVLTLAGALTLGGLAYFHGGNSQVEAQALDVLNNNTAQGQVITNTGEHAEQTYTESNIMEVEQPQAEVTAVIELPKATVDKIDEIMPRIEELKPLYEEAAEAVGLPWQAIAAIHYREADSRSERSAFAGEKLGSKNPDSHTIKPVDKVDNYIAALKHLKYMAKMVYGIKLTAESPLDDWGKAFLAYNRGGMYQNAQYVKNGPWTYKMSPYVMNGLMGYENMQWPDEGGTTDKGKPWGEVKSVQGLTESRIGALAFYEALKRAN